jgi:hypothetical protein
MTRSPAEFYQWLCLSIGVCAGFGMGALVVALAVTQ